MARTRQGLPQAARVAAVLADLVVGAAPEDLAAVAAGVGAGSGVDAAALEEGGLADRAGMHLSAIESIAAGRESEVWLSTRCMTPPSMLGLIR